MTTSSFRFSKANPRPVVMAGPCTAESYELMLAVAESMKRLGQELGFDYVFKASFDKANRTSIDSYRGPGLEQCMKWFQDLKSRLGLPVVTDIHESVQVEPVAKVCDVLQIPAFLCRQTDLIVAAAATGRAVNVKKGQFLAPDNAHHIVGKVREACQKKGLQENLAITERGSSFGYGDLVVDMRGFPAMAKAGAALIFDITHSLQRPAAHGAEVKVTGGYREYAPVLARAATATGYLDGFFLEVHPNPAKAKSDAATQLSLTQAEELLRQIIPLWHKAKELRSGDQVFAN